MAHNVGHLGTEILIKTRYGISSKKIINLFPFSYFFWQWAMFLFVFASICSQFKTLFYDFFVPNDEETRIM